METIRLQTSQNVLIDQQVASVGERILAHLIDYAIFAGYFLFAVFFVSLSGMDSPFIIFLFGLPVLLYDLISELAMDGQNWGKKVVGIKVIRLDGGQLTFFSCFIRWIFRIIDNVMLMGGVSTLTLIINGKGQRLGDLAANTTVIRIKKSDTLGNSIYEELPSDYQVSFSEASRLSNEDISTIREVLDYLKKSGYMGKAAHMAIQTKAVIENKLSVKSDLVPAKFLETVIRDYNAQQR